MSWKLAEMRWRHDVGLNERHPDRLGRLNSLTNTASTPMRRSRSYTAPKCWIMNETSLPEHNPETFDTFRSDPTMLAWSPELFASSTTPLLRYTQDRTSTFMRRQHTDPQLEERNKEPSSLLPSSQTSAQHTLLQCQAVEVAQVLADQRGHSVKQGVSEISKLRERALPSLDASMLSQVQVAPRLSHKTNDNVLIVQNQTEEEQPTFEESRPVHEFRSLIDFEFPRTPNFGLRFQPRGQSYENTQDKSHRENRQSDLHLWHQSLSPTYRRTSIDTIHYSDSALLSSADMDIHPSNSSPEGRTTHALFADFHSAHAQIQGRRAASLQQISSSTSGTRFPLSPSSSSSEEEPLERVLIGSNAVPMRKLPCQNVTSAQITLHEADHHPESSAIFETSTDSITSKRRDTHKSTTLEDIVSRYADASPSNSPPTDSHLVSAHRHGSTYSAAEVGAETPADADPFHDRTQISRNDIIGREPYQLGQQSSKRTTAAADNICGILDDDEEWETAPESSRSGFCTPSKLRFQVRKRKTMDTTTSGWTGRTPTSPWDPLSQPAPYKEQPPRPQLRYSPRPTNPQGHLSSSQHHRRKMAKNSTTCLSPSADTSHKETGVTRQRQRSLSTRVSPLRAEKASSQLPDHSVFMPNVAQSPPDHSTTNTTSNTLASSSLLPKLVGNVILSQPPTGTMAASNEASKHAVEERMPRYPATGVSHNKRTKGDTSFSPARHRSAVSGGSLEGQLGSVDSATTFKPYNPQSNIRLPGNDGVGAVRKIQKEALLARQLYTGEYGLDDEDVSRFLRDSRRLRHGLETEQEFTVENNLFNQQGFRATGSSLANLSSNSTTLNRLRSSVVSTSGSHYSDDEVPAALVAPPIHRVLQFAHDKGNNIKKVEPEYQSLGNLRAPHHNVKQSSKYRQAFLISNEAAISADIREVQRKAGGLLMVFGALTCLVGGWTLIHSMAKGGPLATTAMAEVTRMLVEGEEGVVCCVHPLDAAMAKAIERAVLVLVVIGVLAWLAVMFWAAATI